MTRLRPLTDEEFNALPDVTPNAFPSATPAIANGMLSDADMDALPDADMPVEGRALNMIGNGLTFGLLPRATAAWKAGALSGPEYEAAKQEEWRADDAYSSENPMTSFALEAAGALPTMFVPGLGGARIAQAAARGGQAATGLSRSARLARFAGFGSNIGTTGSEAAALGMKAAALTGGLSSREDTVGGRLGDAAIAAPIGYAGGRVGDAIGKRLVGTADNLEQAARIGFGGDAAAISSLKETIDAQGKTVGDLITESIPTGTAGSRVIPDHAAAIFNAHAAAREAGADSQAALQAAARVYQALNPTTNKGLPLAPATVLQRARSVISGLDKSFTLDGPQMVAAERLSGTQRPIQGALKGVTQQLANSPGASRSIAADVLNPRTEAATDRARQLITDNLGGPDYTSHLADLKNTAKYQRNIAYGLAKANARPFDIAPTLAKHTAIGRTQFGQPGEELNTMGAKVQEWWQRIPKPTGNEPPQVQAQMRADMLNSYKQVRASITERIEKLKNPLSESNSRESANLLQQLKRDLDARVALPNRTWWKANRLAAEDFRIENAADKGRTLALQEGAPVQEAKQWYRRTASPPERKAFERGLARQYHDKVSKLGDTHDVSKGMLTGSALDDEGMRGLAVTVMGPVKGARFLKTLERERTALSTFNLARGSQTGAILAEQDKRGMTSRLMTAMRWGLNPLSILEDLGKHVAGRASEARDAALARRLFSTDKDAYLQILRDIQRANAPTRVSSIFNNPSANAYAAPGLVSGAFGVAGTQERERE